MKVEENKNKIDLLFNIIYDVAGVSRENIKGARRSDKCSISRNILGCILYNELGLTLVNTGAVIGRDYSTVVYYLRNHDNNIKYFKEYREVYTKTTNIFWKRLFPADSKDIDIQIKGLEKQIEELKRKQELITKN